jgi:hypothetical protein
MESEERSPEQPVAREEGGGTSPSDPTHEATTPPGNPDADEDAVREATDGLEQAGGGH